MNENNMNHMQIMPKYTFKFYVFLIHIYNLILIYCESFLILCAMGINYQSWTFVCLLNVMDYLDFTTILLTLVSAACCVGITALQHNSLLLASGHSQ